jgi:hypothetical protein
VPNFAVTLLTSKRITVFDLGQIGLFLTKIPHGHFQKLCNFNCPLYAIEVTLRRKFVQSKHHLKITQIVPHQKESSYVYVLRVMINVGDGLINKTGFPNYMFLDMFSKLHPMLMMNYYYYLFSREYVQSQQYSQLPKKGEYNQILVFILGRNNDIAICP